MAHDTAKLEAKLRQVFETGVPFNSLLGLKVESLDPAPKLRFDMRPELIGNARRQHPARRRHLGRARRRGRLRDPSRGQPAARGERARRATFPTIGTIDLRVDYLRPGRGKYFVATGRVVRLGNRVAVAHMELVNDAAELIATGGAAYMLSSS